MSRRKLRGLESSRLRSAAARASQLRTSAFGIAFGIAADSICSRASSGLHLGRADANSLAATTDNNNHFTNTGYSYDAAGNMTNDGVNAYSFDAEDRIKAGGSVNYTYDGNGMRVEKSNGTLYWRSITGDVLAETDLSGNTKNEYVYFAGRKIAWITGGNTYFLYADQVGTIRTITQSNGTMCYDADYTPYGQEIPHTNSCGVTYNYKFTGYERDAETGLDYAFARYYSSRLGRFLSPDPLAGDASDAQSLNRYAYVENDPRNLIDPLGMGPCNGDGEFWMYDSNGDPTQHIPGLTGVPCQPPPQDILAEECFIYGYCDDGGGTTPSKGVDFQALKAAILKILQSKPDCADLLGGLKKATSALDKMLVMDVPNTPIDLKALNSSQAGALSDIVDSNAGKGTTEAETIWQGSVHGNVVVWNQGPFVTFVGSMFANDSTSMQEAVLMHEMSHPITGYTSAAGADPDGKNRIIDRSNSPYFPNSFLANCIQ